MNKILALTLLALGLGLLVIGVIATISFNSDVSRVLTNGATDKTVWMLIAGILSTVIGLIWTLGRWKPV